MEVTATQMRERTNIAVKVRNDFLRNFSESKIKEIDLQIRKASDDCKFFIIVRIPEKIKEIIEEHYVKNGFVIDFDYDENGEFLEDDEIKISWE